MHQLGNYFRRFALFFLNSALSLTSWERIMMPRASASSDSKARHSFFSVFGSTEMVTCCFFARLRFAAMDDPPSLHDFATATAVGPISPSFVKAFEAKGARPGSGPGRAS